MTNDAGSGDIRKVGLVVEVDATAAKTGAEAVKTAVRDMARDASASGQQAAAGVAAIGTAAEQAAGVSERRFKSMVDQIKRSGAELEAALAGTGTAGRLEALAKARGFSAEQLAAIGPQLKHIEETERKFRATAGAMDQTGLSAKQMSFAMRGLPAQFTDIWTSLASGQRPMMVLLQQGGQIKDMFGGIVPAARAVAQGVMSMINPFTVAAAAVGGLAVAYSKGAAEGERMRDALIVTGNAAGRTFAQMQAMAVRMDAIGTTQGKASSALEAFVRAGAAGSAQLERFAQAAVQMERAGGPAVEKTAEAFAQLAREPLKATLELNRSMNYLSESTLEQITALERAGKTTQAATVAQQAYARALEERTPQMLQNLGLIEKAWAGIKSTASEAWDAMLNVGREQSRLQTVAQEIALLERGAGGAGGWGYVNDRAAQERLRALREERDNLQEQERLLGRLAVNDQLRAERVRARAAWDQSGLDFLTKQQRLAQELNRIEEQGLAAGRDRAEIEARKLAATAKYAEKAREAVGFDQEQGKAYQQYVEGFIQQTQKAEAAALNLTAGQAKLLAMVSDPAWQAMPEAWKQQALQVAYAAVEQEQLNEATKEYDRLQRQVQANMDKSSASYARETQQIAERAAKLELETRQIGLSKDAQAQLAIAQQQAHLDELRALRDMGPMHEADIEYYDKRIEAVQRLIAAMGAAGEAGALMDLRRDWQRFAEQIEQSLTDAMVRGFESGRGIFKSVGDWMANYFRTVVARGIAQSLTGVVASVMSSMASASGGGGIFGGAGGGGGSGVLGNLGSLASMFGTGASIFGAGGAGGAFLGGLGASLGTGAGMFGGFSAAGSLMGTGTLGGMASGGVMALGAAVPYIAAAYAAYRLISGVGTGRARGPAFQEWGTSGPMSDIFAGGINNPGGGSWQGGHYSAQVGAIVDAVTAAARSLGGTANAGTTFGLYSAQSPDGLGANTLSAVVGADGAQRYWMNRTGGNADVAQLFADTVPGMILAGLQDANLPAQIKDFLDGLDANVTQAQLDSILAIATAAQQMADSFKQLGGPFQQLTDLSVQARAGILDLTGGLESFLQKSAGYVQNFYSDEERQALSLASVQRTLTGAGIDTSGLSTTADFRRLVESLDLSTETGQRQFAALMNSADSFAFGADLLGTTGMSLSQLTASAPSTVGVDLMVSAQVTTNSLLERIEAAIRETGAQTVAAVEAVMVGGGGGGVGGEIVNLYDGTTGGGN